MRITGKGLSGLHCRKHVVHHQRHGSHWHGTYKAADIKPYLRAAQSYIAPRLTTELFIKQAVAGLAMLIESAPYEHATRLRGLKARTRADIAFGRLRNAGVKPERLLAIHMAIALLVDEDQYSAHAREFRIVQTAKAIHRLASGHHVYYPEVGQTYSTGFHKFPPSSGQVLRIIGEMVDRCCETATAEHAEAVMALKVHRYGKHPSCVE